MRSNSRNPYFITESRSRERFFFEARAASSASVLSVFNALTTGRRVLWADLYPPSPGMTPEQIDADIVRRYNDTSSLPGRGEALIKYLIDKGQTGGTYSIAGGRNNPWDILVAGKTYDVKQSDRTILLGGLSSAAAINLIREIETICRQINLFCQSFVRTKKNSRIRDFADRSADLLARAARGNIGLNYFIDLGQLVVDINSYVEGNSTLPVINLSATLEVGGKISSRTFPDLQNDPKKVASIKDVLFPEDLQDLNAVELYHEVFQDIDFVDWEKSIKHKAVEEAIEGLKIAGIFLVDPQGVVYVPSHRLKNFKFYSITRSRISLEIPEKYIY